MKYFGYKAIRLVLSFSESPPAPNSGGEGLSHETSFGLN